MATTRESIEDTLRWCVKLLRIFVRRALITSVFVALFAVAVMCATRERFSDCSSVTEEQRAVIASLGGPSTAFSFRASGDAGCGEGEYRIALDGLADRMEPATSQLLADGWRLETEFFPHFQQLWRRCFSLDEPGWERIQVTVDAQRSGSVHVAHATALEGTEACADERRDASLIYPPSR